MLNVIVDIDGTIADHSHRLHHITGKIRDRKNYNALASQDKPIMKVIFTILAICNMLPNAHIHFITGRTEELRQVTTDFIEEHFFLGEDSEGLYSLHMRPVGDHREDVILKKEIFDNIGKPVELYFAVFEDRPRVCKMRRDMGLFVFNVDQSGKRF